MSSLAGLRTLALQIFRNARVSLFQRFRLVPSDYARARHDSPFSSLPPPARPRALTSFFFLFALHLSRDFASRVPSHRRGERGTKGTNFLLYLSFRSFETFLTRVLLCRRRATGLSASKK